MTSHQTNSLNGLLLVVCTLTCVYITVLILGILFLNRKSSKIAGVHLKWRHLALDPFHATLSISQEVFPVHYGPRYDTALQTLVWEFLSRLEELLPIPDLTQVLRKTSQF